MRHMDQRNESGYACEEGCKSISLPCRPLHREPLSNMPPLRQRVAQQVLFRLDYSRVSGLYRMIDGFAPEVRHTALVRMVILSAFLHVCTDSESCRSYLFSSS